MAVKPQGEGMGTRRGVESHGTPMASLKMKWKPVTKLQARQVGSRKRPHWPHPQAWKDFLRGGV